MKASTGTIGLLAFTAVATAVFVLMAKRPAVEGNALVFGMPAETTAASTNSNTPSAVIEPKAEKVEDNTETKSTSTEAEPKTEDVTEPSASPSTTPAETSSTATPETKAPEAEPKKQEAPTEPEPTEKENSEKPEADDVIQKTTIEADSNVDAIIKSASEIKIPSQ